MLKRFLSVILSLVLVASTSAFALNPAVLKAHKAAHQIRQDMFLIGGAGCSATAIGPQALLTATHCELPTDVLEIRGVNAPVTIVDRIRDGQDHTIYLLRNVHFADYVDVSLSDPLEQGEDVFVWGNPGSWSDQFRKGYITGIVASDDDGPFGISTGPTAVLFDLVGYHGDSGAAVLNADGKIICVISTINMQARKDDPVDSIRLMGGYTFLFSAKDLERARAFSAPDTKE